MQAGGWFGYVLFGFIADSIGRKKAFTIFFTVATVLVPVYAVTRNEIALLLLGPFLIFFRAFDAVVEQSTPPRYHKG